MAPVLPMLWGNQCPCHTGDGGALPSTAAAAAGPCGALDVPEDPDSEEPSHSPHNWHTGRGRVGLGNWASQAVLGGLLSVKKIRTRINALAVECNQQIIQVQVGCNAACLDPSYYSLLKLRQLTCATPQFWHLLCEENIDPKIWQAHYCVFYIQKQFCIFITHSCFQ